MNHTITSHNVSYDNNGSIHFHCSIVQYFDTDRIPVKIKCIILSTVEFITHVYFRQYVIQKKIF
jgi:hypothetical protein